MTPLQRTTLAVILLGASCSAPSEESSPLPVSGTAHEVLPWAFVLNDPGDGDARPADQDERVTVPGSALTLRRGDIALANGPPDWHPDGHPPMPEVVARGGEDPAVMPCGYCHLPNGQGKPENSSLAGLPYEYILRQLEDWRLGLRRTGEPRMTPPSLMMGIGAAVSGDDAREAARYFSSLPYRRWIRVVETDEVPVTRFAGWMHEALEGPGREPLGTRVVETPEDLERTRLRDDQSGFVAYVPRGSVAEGERLVRSGRNGRTVPCTVCHGEDLRGMGPIPPLAGRSPSYLARQLYDFMAGNRNGAWSALMDGAVAGLTEGEVVALVAYLASLEP